MGVRVSCAPLPFSRASPRPAGACSTSRLPARPVRAFRSARSTKPPTERHPPANLRRQPEKALVLDLDAVIVPQCPLIGDRICKFVADHLKVSLAAGTNLNRIMYKTYGHSYIGLKKHCFIPQSFSEFNQLIYKDLDEFAGWLAKPDTIAKAEDAGRAISDLKLRGFVPVVFTNAPSLWCDFVLESTGLSAKLPIRLTCDDAALLKPLDAAYGRVERHLGSNVLYHFVDDSITNLAPVYQRDRWSSYHFKDGDSLTDLLDILY